MACSSSFLSKVKYFIESKDANGLSVVTDEILKEIFRYLVFQLLLTEDELRARLVHQEIWI